MVDLENLFENEKSPVFIVAEIGLNHGGNFNRALHLIELAKQSGADAVKFQLYQTEGFILRNDPNFGFFKKHELNRREITKLKTAAENIGLIFFVTPLDEEAFDFILKQKPALIKIASSDLFTEPFLEKAALSGVKVILSTGMADEEEVEKAVSFFPPSQRALLYCVSEYPSPAGHFDLQVIPRWIKKFGGVIGFSDHSEGIALSLAAVTLGARIIERHFTDNKAFPTGDNTISLEAREFQAMVQGIRDISAAMGKGLKKPTENEIKIKASALRGIYAKHPIHSGELVSPYDVKLLRPGHGVTLKDYMAVIGKKAGKDFIAHEKI